MVDRVVDPENDIPVEDVDDVLKAVIVAVLDEAADKMEEGKDVIPFTGLAVKENLFIETHPGDDAEECFLAARKEVQALAALRHTLSATTVMLTPMKARRTRLSPKVVCLAKSGGTHLATFTMRTALNVRLSTSVLLPTLWKTSSLSSRWREPSILKNRKKQPRNRKLGRGSRQRCRLSFFAR